MIRVSESKSLFSSCSSRFIPFFALVLAASMWGGPTASAVERQQSISLLKGWNSVFLEVEPTLRKPAELFAGTPIEIVAGFFPQTRPAAYIRNPGDAPWREEGWAVWYAPGRPDAVVTSLHAVNGNQPYLVHSTADFTWKVSGQV